MKQLLIIGGGAAGIAAALSAAREAPNAHITILEGLDRVGKKLLSTGNGRCNLTNQFITAEHYHSQSADRMAELLADMPVERTLEFFRFLGLYCTTEDMGRVYPYSRQASMVLDVLLLALTRSNIDIIYGAKVKELIPRKKSWLARTEQGDEFYGDLVILTTGGRAAPKQGSTGSAYPITARLGHHYESLYPCLVPFKCNSPVLKGLKGVRLICRCSLYRGKQKAAEELGELQLTDYGLSGIPIFQLSCHLGAFKSEDRWSVRVDLMPDWDYSELRELMQERIRTHGSDALDLLLIGLIPRKVGYAVLKTRGIEPLSRQLSSLTKKEIDDILTALKSWSFPVSGTLSWEHAQVTGGGISLNEIDDDFQSKLHSGLYLAGEPLDIVGDCGGYNLHWAWCSGMTAGAAAAKALNN